MSIATEITRLQNAKTAIKTAIEGKGVTVPDATLLDGMASLIESIEAGGGGDTSVEDGLVTREITSYTNSRVLKIGSSAFYDCSKLTTVNLPTVTSISDGAFYQCSALTSVALRNTEKVCTLSNTSAFTYTPIASGTGYIYVPDALVDQYKAATNWSAYAAQIKPLSEYTEG